ncbi:hypothetical protein SAMN06297280_1328 [Arsukibacterium tuosuense]|uniref:Uncharacterized protein n=1 Tax=Arsukibacterium tuosuense TaxID=1323745 RepID=A0A285IMT5_9GAMM|nr:hypothetical protein [Arsukibacterium tuosuense]SNY49299.1 hypothetical protein SAMN06297280_1328 [Arsukibacterium tuosuense]
MTSSTIRVRNIPKATAVFFDIVLRSKPVFLGYQILILAIVLAAIALESNNYISRLALYWVVGTSLTTSYVFLALAPWVNNQFRLILVLVLTVVLFTWWE